MKLSKWSTRIQRYLRESPIPSEQSQLLCFTVLMFCRLLKIFIPLKGSSEVQKLRHLKTTIKIHLLVLGDREATYNFWKLRCLKFGWFERRLNRHSVTTELKFSVFLLSVALFVNTIRCVITTKQISTVENECPLCVVFSLIGLCFQLSLKISCISCLVW